MVYEARGYGYGYGHDHETLLPFQCESLASIGQETAYN